MFSATDEDVASTDTEVAKPVATYIDHFMAMVSSEPSNLQIVADRDMAVAELFSPPDTAQTQSSRKTEVQVHHKSPTDDQ